MKRCILTVLACFWASWASAQTIDDFYCPSGTWSNADCWVQVVTNPPQHTLPQSGENVQVGPLDGLIDFDVSATVGTMSLAGIADGLCTLSQSGNDLAAVLEVIDGYCEYLQTGGTNTASTLLGKGEIGVWGIYEFNDGSITADIETVGVVPFPQGGSSPGSFAQNGGTNTPNYLQVGTTPFTTTTGGTYTLSAGNLSAHHEAVGDNANSGTFNQTGGTNEITSTTFGLLGGVFILGRGPNSTGTYKLIGTSELSADTEIVAENGTGNFTQSGGENTVSKLILGQSGGETSSGNYTLSQGALKAKSLVIGDSGTGEFTQNGGTTQVNGDLVLAGSSGGKGGYSLNGGKLTVFGDEIVGSAGTGEFIQEGGTDNIVTQTLTTGNERSTGTLGGYHMYGGRLVANLIVNNGVFVFFGGVINADVTNNGLFDVGATSARFTSSTLTVFGNFTNNGTISCDAPVFGRGTTLHVTGTFTNNGRGGECVF